MCFVGDFFVFLGWRWWVLCALLLSGPPHMFNKILRENGTAGSAFSPVGQLSFTSTLILISEAILHRIKKVSLVIRQKRVLQ